MRAPRTGTATIHPMMALRRLPSRRLLLRGARALSAAAASSSSSSASSSALQLVSGAFALPHPQKRATGGEDAWFVRGDTVGVADGVGGWARKGVDAGEYSRSLMRAAAAAVPALAELTPDGRVSRQPTPLELLTYAHRSATCAGSSTACIVQLHEAALRAINLGDSGFLVCRLLPGGAARSWQVVYESPNQCHYFNCPYQLGHGNGDQPAHGQLIDVETQEGDVVLLGTDGLFDNLFPSQIAALLDSVWPADPEISPASMEKVASCVAHTAHKAAKNTKTRSPFALAAERAGYQYLGGKMDDITVVASLVAAA